MSIDRLVGQRLIVVQESAFIVPLALLRRAKIRSTYHDSALLALIYPYIAFPHLPRSEQEQLVLLKLAQRIDLLVSIFHHSFPCP